MSTRATYVFQSNRMLKANTTAIYIHYDGYPDGAAVYFWTAMRKPSKGCPATQFIRANDQAELTDSHDAHGDTEFRYTINGDNWETAEVVCEERLNYSEKWRVAFRGTVLKFLEKHPRMLESFEPFREVQLRWGQARWLNTETAREPLQAAYGHLEIWSKGSGMKRGSANWDGCEEEVRMLLAAFPALADMVTAEVLAG